MSDFIKLMPLLSSDDNLVNLNLIYYMIKYIFLSEEVTLNNLIHSYPIDFQIKISNLFI